MGTVIGPIDWKTWYCMRQCSESVRWYKSQPDCNEYRAAIDSESGTYRWYMDRVLKRAA